MIDRTNHHLFQPLLYQVATGILSEGQIAPAIRDVLRRMRNLRVVLGEVSEHRPRRAHGPRRRVRRPQVMPYDSLIVAGGAVTSYYGHDEFRRSPRHEDPRRRAGPAGRSSAPSSGRGRAGRRGAPGPHDLRGGRRRTDRRGDGRAAQGALPAGPAPQLPAHRSPQDPGRPGRRRRRPGGDHGDAALPDDGSGPRAHGGRAPPRRHGDRLGRRRAW